MVDLVVGQIALGLALATSSACDSGLEWSTCQILPGTAGCPVDMMDRTTRRLASCLVDASCDQLALCSASYPSVRSEMPSRDRSSRVLVAEHVVSSFEFQQTRPVRLPAMPHFEAACAAACSDLFASCRRSQARPARLTSRASTYRPSLLPCRASSSSTSKVLTPGSSISINSHSKLGVTCRESSTTRLIHRADVAPTTPLLGSRPQPQRPCGSCNTRLQQLACPAGRFSRSLAGGGEFSRRDGTFRALVGDQLHGPVPH